MEGYYPQFGTVSIHDNTSVRGHCMQVHMLAEPTPICFQNLSDHSVEIPTKAVVGQVRLANQVPPVVLPAETSGVHLQPPKGWILEALNLQGLGEWPEAEQEWARELLLKLEHLFACCDLDPGRTALIKQQIEVTDWIPSRSITNAYLLICMTL